MKNIQTLYSHSKLIGFSFLVPIECRKLSRLFYETHSYSDQEVKKFSKLASKWWNRHGELKALHSMNRVRVPFIRDNLLLQGIGVPFSSKPLQNISILDVGCGAGILSENLARLGALVLGIDPSTEAIEAAKLHRGSDPDLQNLQYLDSPIEDIVSLGNLKYDCIVMSEVIEHCVDPKQFVEYSMKVLNPKGSIFVSTINRTTASYLMAIIAAEKVFGLIPSNTHDWNKFITPIELSDILSNNGCLVRKFSGMVYNPIFDKWSWSEYDDVNYILHAMKRDDDL